MPELSSTSPTESVNLLETAASTCALLRRFSVQLTARNADPSSSSHAEDIPNLPNPLDILHDSAKLLKAHSTKLSLLSINEPFSPTALRTVISEATSSCIPGLMSAVETCQSAVFGRTLYKETNFGVRKAFRGFEDVIEEIVTVTKAHDRGSARPLRAKSNKNSLVSTGILWDICDGLMELRSTGAVGLLVRKAEAYRSTLEDAIAELRGWGREEDDDNEVFTGVVNDEIGADDGESSIERFLSGSDRLPAEREDLRNLLATALKRLKLISTLYQALIKRRLLPLNHLSAETSTRGCTLPPEHALKADSILDLLGIIPDHADELASTFYDLEEEEATKALGKICQDGRDIIALTYLNWAAEVDEFSHWSDKWNAAVELA